MRDDVIMVHVDVSIVHNDILDLDAFRKWRKENHDAQFELEDGKYLCGVEVEKMSKSKFNVVNPDEIIEKYGADTLRMYEMFLGPLELSKPWNTNGIEGVYKFMRKLWKLFYNESGLLVTDEEPSGAELKSLHKTIRKIEEDIERFSFNTSVSTFMICVNELTELKCHKRKILGQLLVLLSPYAPHIAEELWSVLGNKDTIAFEPFPLWKEEYLVENTYDYPVSINGKTRMKITLPLSLTQEQIQSEVMSHEETLKWLEGKDPKKFIIVPGRIVNIVI